ncbi:AAA family ATPase [Campylobacter sp. MIT 21-1685]|uniref:AAA family ATPase n=1 Tax=unclassified Campylobacter TaxID=2593542 RepID=UPI00224ACCEE|nr:MULTISPECIES: AAA family ATPase [unclassified Campylobacter]MCX2683444.1 AAA family ATPase [Campylobacter sp. MIT 21-1684]MCX2751734.1 AAA family ATPase [Campylobacter sp. MIT 21-1682]MCX2807936.1 AAA family ATPase [Campylobacter sp. MIT 21-1685]
MKIYIKNIGMLDEAEFEVGDLTLICGENNTGKTYATYSLYGYLDYINNDTGYILLNLIEKITQKFLKNIAIEDECVMKISSNIMKSIVSELFKTLNIAYKNSLAEILASKEEDFNNSEFHIDIVEEMISYIEQVESAEIREKVLGYFSYSLHFELLEATREYFLFDYKKSKNRFNEKMQKDIGVRKQIFISTLFRYIIVGFYPYAFILSTERTGATMFQRELDVNKNEIVEKISRANGKNIEETVFNVLNTRYSRYPKPVKDNIYFVRELDEVAKQTSFIKKGEKENVLYKEIIELLYQVIGGKYIVSPEGIEFAPGAKQRITKGKFLVQRASSSVRSLLMLNYYVLHRAQVGDILMIDEPELNLHPKNQILVARLLVLLVNAGIKVFITTHSDYIVRELSNCIMLKNLSNEQITKFKKQGYSKEYGLESKKVKAYLAENIKGKNTLKAVEITQEQGIFMETFDEPIDCQNENQGLIFEEAIRGKGRGNDN